MRAVALCAQRPPDVTLDRCTSRGCGPAGPRSPWRQSCGSPQQTAGIQRPPTGHQWRHPGASRDGLVLHGLPSLGPPPWTQFARGPPAPSRESGRDSPPDEPNANLRSCVPPKERVAIRPHDGKHQSLS